MNRFVHLHVHSWYSAMSGVSSLEEICQAARDQGSDIVALTDTNGLYGVVRFIELAQKNKLKPIIGTELNHGSHRAVLLIKNKDGYANLSRLLSARHCDPSFDLPAAVDRYRQGLVVISDDFSALETWKNTSPDDLYVELTPGFQMRQVALFCRATRLPPVATNRVHFVTREGYALHRLLRAIDLNTTLSRLPEHACASSSQWLAPASFLRCYYSDIPEALVNTWRIAESCRTEWNFKQTIFPSFREPNVNGAFATLKEKSYAGACRRYGKLNSEIRARIDQELAIIRTKRFTDYFLIVQDIVRRSPWVCGRGSAAASIVAYCLGITDVDPIDNGLLFERFLSVARDDPPDIDIDLPWDERDAIIDSIFTEYGTQKVAMVGNQNTLGPRAAVREVAKVYGLAPNEVERGVSFIFKRLELLRLAESPTAQAWAESFCVDRELNDPWPDILNKAFRIGGHLRNLGLHCGGMVLVPDEIRKYAPVEISAKGIPVLQWDKEQVEQAGLVKIDLLGNRSLAVIRDALANIQSHTGQRLDYSTWDPVSDRSTKDLIRRGETMGCFNIESPATRLLLKKIWRKMPLDRAKNIDVFEYLVMVSSLVRPAVNSLVTPFIRRTHGGFSSPRDGVLEEILPESHGIMLYQEDVTKVAMEFAGFFLEDAEQLRKILNKKHKQLELKDYQERFYRNAATRGVCPDTIRDVWKMMLSFAGYSFCKPHSVSYAQLSFKCAYLKAHFPGQFMAAVISNEGGFYPTFAYVSEAWRMGLEVLPPDINSSDWSYTASGKTLRAGLMQIKGMERPWTDRMLANRKDVGPFRSFDDFCRRMQPKLAQARLLIKAGCFDSIAHGLTRPGLLWHAYGCDANEYGGVFPNPSDYSEKQKVRHEVETFGFPLSRHPLEVYASRLKGRKYLPARDLHSYVGQRITMIGWLISEKITQTRKGDPMEFVTFEDATGLYETTFFPRIHRQFHHLIRPNQPYVLRGKVEEDFGVATLNVHHIEYLDTADASAIVN